MDIKSFADFIVKYSNDNFDYVEDPMAIAGYGLIEEWGEFVGEYKRLMRDNFSHEAVIRFNERGLVEWADIVAYWIIFEHHRTFGMIDFDKIAQLAQEGFSDARSAIAYVGRLLPGMVFSGAPGMTTLSGLFCIYHHITDVPMSEALQSCVDKLVKRELEGRTRR